MNQQPIRLFRHCLWITQLVILLAGVTTCPAAPYAVAMDPISIPSLVNVEQDIQKPVKVPASLKAIKQDGDKLIFGQPQARELVFAMSALDSVSFASSASLGGPFFVVLEVDDGDLDKIVLTEKTSWLLTFNVESGVTGTSDFIADVIRHTLRGIANGYAESMLSKIVLEKSIEKSQTKDILRTFLSEMTSRCIYVAKAEGVSIEEQLTEIRNSEVALRFPQLSLIARGNLVTAASANEALSVVHLLESENLSRNDRSIYSVRLHKLCSQIGRTQPFDGSLLQTLKGMSRKEFLANYLRGVRGSEVDAKIPVSVLLDLAESGDSEVAYQAMALLSSLPNAPQLPGASDFRKGSGKLPQEWKEFIDGFRSQSGSLFFWRENISVWLNRELETRGQCAYSCILCRSHLINTTCTSC